MSDIRDIASFGSSQFEPFLPEDQQVNPGVYGAELAFWLSAELARRGVVTTYPNHEDWGWFIEYFGESESEFVIHCSNDEGQRDHWLLSIRRHARKLFGRDKPSFDIAKPLIVEIQRLLSETPGINDFNWLFDSEVAE